MKYLNTYEELDYSTYKSASDKLKNLGYYDRSDDMRKYYIDRYFTFLLNDLKVIGYSLKDGGVYHNCYLYYSEEGDNYVEYMNIIDNIIFLKFGESFLRELEMEDIIPYIEIIEKKYNIKVDDVTLVSNMISVPYILSEGEKKNSNISVFGDMNEELDYSTYKSASDKLKILGYDDRAKSP